MDKDPDLGETTGSRPTAPETWSQSTFVDNLPGAAYRCRADENWSTAFISSGIEAITGYRRQQFLDGEVELRQLVHPDDRERIRTKIEEATSQGEAYELVYRIHDADGSLKWLWERGYLVENGDLEGYVTDITESRRQQELLRERIKELRCLYRVLELTTDDSLTEEEVCAQAAAVVAASMLHADAASVRVVLNESEYCGPGWTPPTVSLRKDILSGSTPIGFIEAGYSETHSSLLLDGDPFLTEEHDLLKTVALHLGQMMTNRKVAEGLAQADRLNAIGQLTGGVAHDFNNLLTVIRGNAELLIDELIADRRLRQLAEMIDAAADRGAELTRGLLAFARRQALEPKAIDSNRLISGMDGLLRRTLGEHIEIELVRGAGLWPALVDSAQLESALLNLCLNARDAMPRGGRLTLETANVHLGRNYTELHDDLEPGQYVMIAVSDTGTGIAADHINRVIEPFFTTKEKGKGTGLGLSMVYGFVKQSLGHLRIYSEPGEGTTVRIYLPRADGSATNASPEPKDRHAASGSELILLVEDDDLVRRFARQQVQALGYDVITAANGPDALKLLRERTDIDLLFTDIVMPGGMSGRELADAALHLRPGLKVLYTSGYTENAIVHHGRLDPGVRLLSKPYRREDLAAALRETLDRD